MKKTKSASAFFTALLVIAIFAGMVPSAVGTNGGSVLFEDIKSMVDVYNQNVEDIPLITSFLGDERIQTEINLTDGGVLIMGITTGEDAKVTDVTKGEISDPTIMAYSDENTVRTIMNSNDPVSAFQDALNSGAITFEGVGIGDKIKVGVMNVALKIVGFFL